jgi:hypothetical protein
MTGAEIITYMKPRSLASLAAKAHNRRYPSAQEDLP